MLAPSHYGVEGVWLVKRGRGGTTIKKGGTYGVFPLPLRSTSGVCKYICLKARFRKMNVPRDVDLVSKSPFQTILNYRDVGLTINGLQDKV